LIIINFFSLFSFQPFKFFWNKIVSVIRFVKNCLIIFIHWKSNEICLFFFTINYKINSDLSFILMISDLYFSVNSFSIANFFLLHSNHKLLSIENVFFITNSNSLLSISELNSMSQHNLIFRFSFHFSLIEKNNGINKINFSIFSHCIFVCFLYGFFFGQNC
jgi:hypothetical protein